MTITDALTRLVAELAEGGVPDPLDQRFRLAYVFDDLCRLAGESLPAEVAAALDAPACAVVPTVPRRRVPVPRYAD